MKNQNVNAARFLKSITLGLTVATLLGGSAFGQNYIGGLNGNWFTGANWFGGNAPSSVPAYGDVTVYNGNGPQILSFGFANTLQVYGGSFVNVNNAGLEVDNGILLGTGPIFPSAGTLVIQNSSYVDSFAAFTANYGSSVLVYGSGLDMNGNSLTFNHGSVLQLTGGSSLFNVDQLIFNNSSTGLVSVSGAQMNSLYVGYTENNSALTINNGGVIGVNGPAYVGWTNSSNNSLLLNNGTLIVNGGSPLIIGNINSSFNSLVVSNGSYVYSDGATLGYHPGSSNNSAVVTGTNSGWYVDGVLTVGRSEAGNSLTVANGGSLESYGATIGQYTRSSNNTVLVTGPGSYWNNYGWLYVGDYGSSNKLTISNGGHVYSDGAYVGYGSGAPTSGNNNSVLVTGTGSWFEVDGPLFIGVSGFGNSVTISNTGTVFDRYGFVGYNSSASNNSVLVTGVGSQWLNQNDLFVGFNSANNALVISNGGVVTNGYDSYGAVIGYAAGASNNSVLVTGSGSLWSNTTTLTVGWSGSKNSLTISSNGTVLSSYGVVGYADANNNSVLVTGTGSLWSNQYDLAIGYAGANNSLVISNGGAVFNGNDSYGAAIGYATSASNNSVVVTGTGSVWNSQSQLVVGWGGSSNSLTINNGGKVSSQYGLVGFQSGANNNSVLVTGAGSVWSNQYDLGIGLQGINNSLVISNGGLVINNTDGYGGVVGYGAGASNNSVLVTGSGSVWSNYSNLILGWDGSSNSLIITNGGKVFNNNGTIANDAGSSNNWALVTGVGSVWSNSGNLAIGGAGSFNSLTINGSGTVFSANGFIGRVTGANNNSVLVTDPGSVWENGDLFVGQGGAFNSLTISNGGLVYASSYVGVGWNAGASNNSLLVTGAGSVLTNSGDTYVGDDNGTVNNSLIIVNGGKVYDYNGFVSGTGYATIASNSVLVSGAGSSWINSGNLTVGGSGIYNTLFIQNSGTVFSVNGIIGNDANANSNGVLVLGAGSVWTSTGQLWVGGSGSFNVLAIANGGVVNSGSGFIGRHSGSSNNIVFVEGAGSAWNIAGDLTVGDGAGGNNVLEIISGGVVSNINGYIGYWSHSGSNAVVVAGAGSKWINSGDLYVGYNGANNQLLISDSGYVSVNPTNGTTSYIGYNASSSNNSVLVDHATWNNQCDLYVGYSGASNQLSVAQDGHVFSVNGYIGYNASSSNNTVVAQEAVSYWSWLVSSNLYIGYNGANNSLIVSNGGAVSANNVIVGANASSTNNQLTLDNNLYFYVNQSLDVRNGTLLVTHAADLSASQLIATNGANSVVQFNGGAVYLDSATVSNLSAFVIGDGIQQAYLRLASGVSSFANDLVLSTNGYLQLDSPVTVNVGGSYTQQANSTLEVYIAGTNTHGKIVVTGNANLNGTLITDNNGYVPQHLDAEVLIVASNGVTGTFSAFTNYINHSVFLTTNLIYNTYNVTLRWDQLSFTNFFGHKLTPNQWATAGGLDSTSTSSIPSAIALLNFIDYLPTNAIPGALDLISPAQLSAMPGMALAGMDAGGNSALNRLQDLRAGSHGLSTSRLSLYDHSGPGQSQESVYQADSQIWAAGDGGVFSASKDNPWGLYVEGNGELVSVNTDDSNGYHFNSMGLTVGLDRRLGENLVVGVSVSYASNRALLSNSGNVDVDNEHANLYATWFNNGYYVNALVGGGISSYDTRRDTIGGIASGSTSGTEFNGLFGGGYDWKSGIWSFGPQVSLKYKQANIDQFTEHGSMAPLTLLKQSDESFQTLLGGQASCETHIGKTLVTPNLSLSWQHEYLDKSAALDARFANGAGNIFTTHGPVVGADSLVIGVGVGVQITQKVGTYLNYSTELGRNNYTPHNINAGVNIGF